MDYKRFFVGVQNHFKWTHRNISAYDPNEPYCKNKFSSHKCILLMNTISRLYLKILVLSN